MSERRPEIERTVVGNRFTKREALGEHVVRLDLSDYFNVEHARSEGLALLASHGYAEDVLYGAHGECVALDRVRLDRHDDDSPAGLAAQALMHVRELQSLVAAYPEAAMSTSWKQVADHAYRIGRCLGFAKAYSILSSDGARGGRRKIVSDDQVRDTWDQVLRDARGVRLGAISATANRLGIDRGQCSKRLRDLGLVE